MIFGNLAFNTRSCFYISQTFSAYFCSFQNIQLDIIWFKVSFGWSRSRRKWTNMKSSSKTFNLGQNNDIKWYPIHCAAYWYLNCIPKLPTLLSQVASIHSVITAPQSWTIFHTTVITKSHVQMLVQQQMYAITVNYCPHNIKPSSKDRISLTIHTEESYWTILLHPFSGGLTSM